MAKVHPQAKEIRRLRRLLPEETKDLQDENVAFMASRLEGVADAELQAKWKQEMDAHLKEWAVFLYDMYQEKKLRERELPPTDTADS